MIEFGLPYGKFTFFFFSFCLLFKLGACLLSCSKPKNRGILPDTVIEILGALGPSTVNSILVMSNDEVDRRVKRDEFSQMSAMRNDSVTRFGRQKMGRHWPMKMEDVS